MEKSNLAIIFCTLMLGITVIPITLHGRAIGCLHSIGGLWHAGSYDPHDFLGRLIGDKPWVRNAERSMFACYNDNFFATQFYRFVPTIF